MWEGANTKDRFRIFKNLPMLCSLWLVLPALAAHDPHLEFSQFLPRADHLLLAGCVLLAAAHYVTKLTTARRRCFSPSRLGCAACFVAFRNLDVVLPVGGKCKMRRCTFCPAG